MAIESKEFKVLGTLLCVTNLALNALVNSSYNLIDPSFSLLNHLMVVRLRLDRKTLCMKDLFIEWMAILWLKWLTCSTGPILPL